MAKALKNRASKQNYVSPQQLTLAGFESPFSNQLLPTNRWVILANRIPWDALVSTYNRQLGNKFTGAGSINPRVAIGALIIKHLCDISDRETILQIQENMYMQYFIGYSSFSNEAPFDASLFVDIRKRLTLEHINEINEKILGIISKEDADKTESNHEHKDGGSAGIEGSIEKSNPAESVTDNNSDSPNDTGPHEGVLLIDATACPQDIAYPTDLNLLNDAREKSEELIDELQVGLTTAKPRTYREIARKQYLKTAQKKKKTRKEIRKAIRQQLQYLKRNISSILKLLNQHDTIPLRKKQYKYLLVIQSLYDQQKYMYDKRVHSVEDRIVSIHQPHVRPIVRGKTNANVEFGSKIQVSLINGIAFLDELSWDAFNEGACLKRSVEKHKTKFGFYPKEVLADKIYCTRENRKWLKQRNIKLRAKPLGRPSSTGALSIPVRPGERNSIEGKFGQAKTAYGMNRIKARLSVTSESWIASIVLVLNLIKIIGEASLSLIFKLIERIKFLYQQPEFSKIRFALT